jgi:DNA ligase 1
VNEIPANINEYLASEKLDGVRCVWTGYEFISRHGKVFKSPAWFAAGMPEGVRLDGELYMGRDTFGKLQSAMQRKGSDWAGIKFHVFDLAAPRASTVERLAKLATIPLPAHCELVEHVSVTREQLDEMEAAIVNGGGEGVCLRHRDEFYSPLNFVKVKRLFPDLERWQG